MSVTDAIQRLLGDESVQGWDRGFCESIQEQIKRGRSLTEKQAKAFEKVARRHSKEAKQERAEWVANFDDEKQERLKLIAGYYRRIKTYFVDVALSVEQDENFVPTQKQYHAMCENKFADKVWQNYKTPAKFNVSDLVTIRKVSRLETGIRGKVCIVLDNTPNRFEYFKGGRPYDVFVIEGGRKLQLHERDIMRKRK